MGLPVLYYRGIQMIYTLTINPSLDYIMEMDEFNALLGFTAEHWIKKYKSLSGSGYTNDNLTYKNLLGLVHPDTFSASSYEQYQDKLSALGRFNYNYRIKRG